MKAHDREVAGLRCSEVLASLSDYVDGLVAPEEAERIEAHLRGCDWCERFGGDFGAALAALRRRLASPEPPDAAVRARLRARLRAETGRRPATPD